MDLREINDEQFKTQYSYIKNETKNFTELKPEFLKENPQYLLVIRTALGLSQLEFSKKLGTANKQWVRHFEAGRQGHKWSKLFYPCVKLINESFSKGQALKFEDALFHWIKSRAARKKFFLEDFKSKYKLKKISEMAIDDFKQYFGY